MHELPQLSQVGFGMHVGVMHPSPLSQSLSELQLQGWQVPLA
jgi:hypothetical protein